MVMLPTIKLGTNFSGGQNLHLISTINQTTKSYLYEIKEGAEASSQLTMGDL